MTSAELGAVFQVDDHEDVPEYEVINIHHWRQKRSADRGSEHQVEIVIASSFNRHKDAIPTNI